MEETGRNNYVLLRGDMSTPPRFSHESRGERFFQFSLDVARLSGTMDTIHILAREQLLDELEVPAENGTARKLCVCGELRACNIKSGGWSMLVITVLARELWLDAGTDENTVCLTGALCKAPTHRITPMGREICDLMLAVNRRYGRSDYLPCIVWGVSAREAARWPVGWQVHLDGRIQSRRYTKMVGSETVEKVAYEVSVIHIAPVENQGCQ